MSVVQSSSLAVPLALDLVNRVQRECGVEQIVTMASPNKRSEVVREALNDAVVDIYNRARWEWLVTTHNIRIIAGRDQYQLPQNFDRLARPVQISNVPMKEYTAIDWPYYVPVVDAGGQGQPNCYMVHNQILSVYPQPNQAVLDQFQFIICTYYKHAGERLQAVATSDLETWDIPPQFVEPLVVFGKYKLKLFLEYPDAQAEVQRYEQLIQQNMNKRRSALQNPQMHQRFDPTKMGGNGWNFWG